MEFLVGITSLVGGIILREIMSCFGIELMSVKGFIICLVVAIIYSLIINSICNK